MKGVNLPALQCKEPCFNTPPTKGICFEFRLRRELNLPFFESQLANHIRWTYRLAYCREAFKVLTLRKHQLFADGDGHHLHALAYECA